MQNFFNQIKFNLIRDSDFTVYMDARFGDPIMTCAYMHQAFDEWVVRFSRSSRRRLLLLLSCSCILDPVSVIKFWLIDSVCVATNGAVAAHLQIFLLNLSTHCAPDISFSSSLVPVTLVAIYVLFMSIWMSVVLSKQESYVSCKLLKHYLSHAVLALLLPCLVFTEKRLPAVKVEVGQTCAVRIIVPHSGYHNECVYGCGSEEGSA